MKLAYFMAAHKGPDQLRSLVRSIYSPENYYLLHMDRVADAACHAAVRELDANYPNVWVLPGKNIHWGGYSVVANELRGMQRLLALADDWDYFINLSGQDMPLRSQGEISTYLAEHHGRNFIECFRPDLSDRWLNALARIRKVRFEMPFSKRTRAIPLLRIDRSFLLDGAVWYGGSQWFILTREFCQYVAHAKEIAKYRRFFRSTFAADEAFFQTAIMNSEFKKTVVNDTKRYVVFEGESPNPRILTMRDYPALCASNAFFARKFDDQIDQEVINRLADRALQGAPVSADALE
jgi:hypothetical protein